MPSEISLTLGMLITKCAIQITAAQFIDKPRDCFHKHRMELQLQICSHITLCLRDCASYHKSNYSVECENEVKCDL